MSEYFCLKMLSHFSGRFHLFHHSFPFFFHCSTIHFHFSFMVPAFIFPRRFTQSKVWLLAMKLCYMNRDHYLSHCYRFVYTETTAKNFLWHFNNSIVLSLIIKAPMSLCWWLNRYSVKTLKKQPYNFEMKNSTLGKVIEVAWLQQ